MSGYIIKRSILVTEKTYNTFIKDVHNIPFKGRDRRRSKAYYRDIKLFLQHLICNCFLYADPTPNSDPYTEFSPIASKLGKEKLPFVFKQNKYLCCERALEHLEQAGIIKIKRHNYGKRHSRKLALSKEYIKRWFDDKSHDEYMSTEHRYIDLMALPQRKDSKILTKDEIITRLLKGQNKPKHATRHVSRETSQYMRRVYQNMGGLRININKLFDYTPQNAIEHLYKAQIIQCLIERGCKLVNTKPLVVEYLPAYQLAQRGTRSFEKNGGFQTLKSCIKWEIFEGYNYDIKSSLLNIVKHELKKYGLTHKRLNKLTKRRIMEHFNVTDKVAKLLIYSLIFSLGQVNSSRKSKVFLCLSDLYGYDGALAKLDDWRQFVRPIKHLLEQLVDFYIERGVNCPGRGLAIRNALKHTYLIKKEKITRKQRRQILAHMIQGIESQAVYDTILNNPDVCGSIEHDGLVTSKPIAWQHSYLKLKLKHINII